MSCLVYLQLAQTVLMKHFILSLLFIFTVFSSFAKHIIGGEVIYQFISSNTSSDSKTYRITVRLFRDAQNCTSATNCATLPASIPIGVFNADNNALLKPIFQAVQTNYIASLPVILKPSCLTNEPFFLYEEGDYTFDIELPNNNGGYTVSYQTCCRVDGITNGGSNEGATYTTNIPGRNTLDVSESDNSSKFETGISVICYNKSFKLDFSAVDPDPQDLLVYSFCSAYNGGQAENTSFTNIAAPPYGSIMYSAPFSGNQPLGALATLDPSTGIISGIAPPTGKYVVSVCVSSFRDGKFINSHRKDFIVTVAPCDFAGAQLKLNYTNCKDSTFIFTNLNNSPLNISSHWDFGDGTFSDEESPTHTYSDTGLYTVKLVVNKGSECADSITSPIRVYPKFIPDFFDNSPMCKNVPVKFTDASFATYGPVNSWKWNFGDTKIGEGTSTVQNPSFIYTKAGSYKVLLTVGSIKGCSDTLSKMITILDKPLFEITNDTLICSIDTLQLNAKVNSTGKITWSPNYMINNVNSFTPLVSPNVTTTYYASYIDDYGCTATDSVKIRVVDFVTLSAIPDTTICRTDSVKLTVQSDALSYTWTPAATLNYDTVQSPIAKPTAATTTYTVTGRIGKCFKNEQIVIRTVPYPKANAGKDTTICFGNNAQLHATGGSIYNWSPSFFLNQNNIPNPIAQTPTASLQYIVEVRDVLGCPKPKYDTVNVNVIRIIADAGPRDTSIVTGQPLLLNAQVNIVNGKFTWTPSSWLSNANIANPIARPEADVQYRLEVRNSIGCIGYDTINVKLFTLQPGLYVPSAFTPNGDATNPNFKPIALGIRSLLYFRVYNRWGELLFSTSQIGVGWDGTYKGKLQNAATYVWEADAIDYLGKRIKRKGSVVLIK